MIVDATTFGHRQSPDILLAISNVSRRWRAIALSNTGLWSYIFPCSLSGVKKHISRSGARLLTIIGRFHSQKVNSDSPSRQDESAVIAAALTEVAHRWKALLWADGSSNNTENVIRLLQTTNAYPMLEWLEITIPQCVPLEMGAANASNAILFPALQTLSLTRVHPMVLPRSAMPSLLKLKLDGLGHNLYFSQLLSLLSGTPALRMLMLQHALPTLDPHRVVNVSRSPPRWIPTGPLNVSGTIGVKLHNLVSLSLNPAPASGLWMLLLFVQLPALETLDLHIYTDPHSAFFQGVTPDGRPFLLRPHPSASENSNATPDAWTVRLPALRTLRITYCISPSPAPTPNIDFIAPPPVQPPPPLPQLRRIVFPALASLSIAHALAYDPRVSAPETTPWPPLQPLPAFDALFHTPDFTRLARLSLAGCALPLDELSDALGRACLRSRSSRSGLLVRGRGLLCARSPRGSAMRCTSGRGCIVTRKRTWKRGCGSARG